MRAPTLIALAALAIGLADPAVAARFPGALHAFPAAGISHAANSVAPGTLQPGAGGADGSGFAPARAGSHESGNGRCVKVLGRDANYVCCGGPVHWSCTAIPSRIPSKLE